MQYWHNMCYVPAASKYIWTQHRMQCLWSIVNNPFLCLYFLVYLITGGVCGDWQSLMVVCRAWCGRQCSYLWLQRSLFTDDALCSCLPLRPSSDVSFQSALSRHWYFSATWMWMSLHCSFNMSPSIGVSSLSVLTSYSVLPRDAVLVYAVILCLSVCLSVTSVLWRWLKIPSCTALDSVFDAEWMQRERPVHTGSVLFCSVPVGRLWKQWLVCYSIVQRWGLYHVLAQCASPVCVCEMSVCVRVV